MGGARECVSVKITVRKNVFFVFTIFAGTIFSKRSWVKVREVRSTQGGTGFAGSLIISIISILPYGYDGNTIQALMNTKAHDRPFPEFPPP